MYKRQRVARAYGELLAGYGEDPGAHLERQFEVNHDEMVAVSYTHLTLPTSDLV